MSKTTTEACPKCADPDATCRHGVKSGWSETFVHLWDCPTCGKDDVLVAYDCEDCEEAVL